MESHCPAPNTTRTNSFGFKIAFRFPIHLKLLRSKVAPRFALDGAGKRHRAIDFLKFLEEIDAQVPEGIDVHIVMDNYALTIQPRSKLGSPAGRTIMSISRRLPSWINLVGRWFAELTRKQIQRGVHTTVRQLEADTFIDLHNRHPKPFKWTKSADQILPPVKRFMQAVFEEDWHVVGCCHLSGL